MKHLRKLSLSVAVFLAVVPVGIVVAILKSMAFALEEIVEAEILLLNWLFTDGDDTFKVSQNYEGGPPEDED